MEISSPQVSHIHLPRQPTIRPQGRRADRGQCV